MNAILGIGIEGFGLTEFGNLLSRLGDRGLGIDVGIAVRLPIESDRVEVRRPRMGDLTALLAEVEVLATEARAWETITGRDRDAYRERIESVYETIEETAAPASLRDAKLAMASEELRAGRPAHIVTASAQTAGFLLSLGSNNGTLNLGGTTGEFVIEIAGNLGAVTLTLVSGQTAADMMAAINSRSDLTGVRSLTSANQHGQIGLRLDSADKSDDAFVSVRVLDDGGIDAGARGGIYELDPNDNRAYDMSTRPIAFGEASDWVTDYGRAAAEAVDPVGVFIRPGQAPAGPLDYPEAALVVGSPLLDEMAVSAERAGLSLANTRWDAVLALLGPRAGPSTRAG